MFGGSSKPVPDIASIIILSIIAIVFFDFIYTFVKLYFTSINMGISVLETVWPLTQQEAGPIFYTAYSNTKQLVSYLVSVGEDRYAVAVMIGLSIVLMAFELEVK